MHVSVVEGPSDCWHHFHSSSNLTVNSRKRSSQFKWYDITRYDITLIKTGRPAVTEPDGMTIKLDDLC